MSSADQYSPWGIPQSSSNAPAGGGHLPAFGPPPGPDPQSPAPPQMQSPYGVPLAGGGFGGFGGSGGGPSEPPLGPDSDGPDKKRKTVLMASAAAVAVVGVAVAVAFAGGGSAKPASLAGSQSSASPSADALGADSSLTSSSTGKPNGDIAANTAPTSGSPLLPTGSATAPGSPTTGAKTTGGPATSKPGAPTTTGAPGVRPSSVASRPATSGPGSSSTPHTSAPGGTTTAAPSHTSPPPPPPPSSDCTYLDLPPQQMPTIQQGTGNGNAVKQLQCLLKKSMLGIKPLVIDGIWGQDTQSALVNFQQCNNTSTVHSPGGNPPYGHLAVDGVAGPQTWSDLYFWDNQYFNNVAYYCNGTR